jgi:Ca2+/Na+ antiporter
MLTRVLVVQPLFSAILDESGEPVSTASSEAVCSRMPARERVGVNGQFWTLLASLLQQAGTALPSIMSEIFALISAYTSTASGTAVGESVGANGAILNALSGLFAKVAAELPTLLPVILQLITLFGGSVNVTPAPTPANA